MRTGNIELEHLKKAVAALPCAFPWDASDEGFTFWEDVHAKLKTYLTQAEKGSECQKEIADLRRRIEELAKRC